MIDTGRGIVGINFVANGNAPYNLPRKPQNLFISASCLELGNPLGETYPLRILWKHPTKSEDVLCEAVRLTSFRYGLGSSHFRCFDGEISSVLPTPFESYRYFWQAAFNSSLPCDRVLPIRALTHLFKIRPSSMHLGIVRGAVLQVRNKLIKQIQTEPNVIPHAYPQKSKLQCL